MFLFKKCGKICLRILFRMVILNNRKTFLTLGVVFFGITIIFALIFTWTLNVGTSTYYIRIDGYWVVKDFDTLNEFQSVYAIISIISSVLRYSSQY